MLNSDANTQIVVAYRDLRMTVEQISEDTGYDVVSVKMCLLANCVEYAQAMEKVDPNELFSQSELKLAKESIVSLARESEIDSVKFRASEFIINEVKGRNDLRALSENSFNITIISETMKRMQQAILKSKEKAGLIVDVEQVAT